MCLVSLQHLQRQVYPEALARNACLSSDFLDAFRAQNKNKINKTIANDSKTNTNKITKTH
jgi:hypothetical protein